MKKSNANKMLPNVKGFGVTTTPQSADGKGFDVPVEGLSIRGMINADLLTDYRVFAPPSDTSSDINSYEPDDSDIIICSADHNKIKFATCGHDTFYLTKNDVSYFNKHFCNKQELVFAGKFAGKDIYTTQEVKNVIDDLQDEIYRNKQHARRQIRG